jgi:hypothetical protein
MAESWTPPLKLEEVEGRCRLSLGGLAYGNGRTLQEAADDLIARLVHLAATFRGSGFRLSPEGPQLNNASLDFIWEIGERAARGEDVRPRVFGSIEASDDT